MEEEGGMVAVGKKREKKRAIGLDKDGAFYTYFVAMAIRSLSFCGDAPLPLRRISLGPCQLCRLYFQQDLTVAPQRTQQPATDLE